MIYEVFAVSCVLYVMKFSIQSTCTLMYCLVHAFQFLAFYRFYWGISSLLLEDSKDNAGTQTFIDLG